MQVCTVASILHHDQSNVESEVTSEQIHVTFDDESRRGSKGM